MLKSILAVGYKTKFAKKDAEALFNVLGNEEAVQKVIKEEGIEGGKWQYVFDELYILLSKEDAKILKGYYFDIVKRGDVEVLWEGFAHLEEERISNTPDPIDEMVEDFFVQVTEEGLDFETVLQKMQEKIDSFRKENEQEVEENEEETDAEAEGTQPKKEETAEHADTETEATQPQKEENQQKKEEEQQENTPPFDDGYYKSLEESLEEQFDKQ